MYFFKGTLLQRKSKGKREIFHQLAHSANDHNGRTGLIQNQEPGAFSGSPNGCSTQVQALGPSSAFLDTSAGNWTEMEQQKLQQTLNFAVGGFTCCTVISGPLVLVYVFYTLWPTLTLFIYSYHIIPYTFISFTLLSFQNKYYAHSFFYSFC